MMAEKKKALGKGLEALFGEMNTPVPARKEEKENKGKPSAQSENSENAVLYVDLDDIRPNEAQPRENFLPSEIEELAASIEIYGVILPVTLRKAEYGYELVAGERRWRAARKAGLKRIPAIIGKYSDEESALVALIENMQRVDLNAMEEANAFKKISEKYHFTQEELARAVGKSRSHIANTLRIMKLPEPIREFIAQGKLTLGHANAIGAIKEEKAQIKAAEKIVKEGLSVRSAEKICSKADATVEKSTKNKKNIKKSRELRELENDLTSSLGAKVIINDGEKGGSIELHYVDMSGLNDLIDLLRDAKKKK